MDPKPVKLSFDVSEVREDINASPPQKELVDAAAQQQSSCLGDCGEVELVIAKNQGVLAIPKVKEVVGSKELEVIDLAPPSEVGEAEGGTKAGQEEELQLQDPPGVLLAQEAEEDCALQSVEKLGLDTNERKFQGQQFMFHEGQKGCVSPTQLDAAETELKRQVEAWSFKEEAQLCRPNGGRTLCCIRDGLQGRVLFVDADRRFQHRSRKKYPGFAPSRERFAVPFKGSSSWEASKWFAAARALADMEDCAACPLERHPLVWAAFGGSVSAAQ